MANPTGKGGRKFVKGQSGNPGGKQKADPIIQQFKQTSYKDFINQLQKYGTLSRTEMAVELQRPDATMFEIMFGQIVASAAKGDKDARNVLLERLWGKVKDVHQIEEVTAGSDWLKHLSTEQIIELVKKRTESKND